MSLKCWLRLKFAQIYQPKGVEPAHNSRASIFK